MSKLSFTENNGDIILTLTGDNWCQMGLGDNFRTMRPNHSGPTPSYSYSVGISMDPIDFTAVTLLGDEQFKGYSQTYQVHNGFYGVEINADYANIVGRQPHHYYGVYISGTIQQIAVATPKNSPDSFTQQGVNWWIDI